MSWAIIMTYISITKFVLINLFEKDHNMIETRHLKNIVIFIQTIFKRFCCLLLFYHDIASRYSNETTLSRM